MAYRAEIEIAVKGARELDQLKNRINNTAKAIDEINSGLSSVSQTAPATFSAISNAVRTAQQNLNNAARGTSVYGNALDDLIAAEKLYNQELRERDRLLNNIRAAQQAAGREVSPGSTGFTRSQYGPAMSSGAVQQVEARQSFPRFLEELAETAKVISVAKTNTETSWNRFFSEAEEVAKELQATANTRQGTIKQSWNRFLSEAEEVAKELQATANTRQGTIKQSWNKFFIEANQTADELKDIAITKEGKIKQSWTKFFAQAEEIAVDITQTAKQRSSKRFKEAASSAIIGGAFPLLFGQGVGASVGGGLGGAAGGLIGGQFGFGLSLVGTAVGQSFDNLVNGAKELGTALNKNTFDYNKVAEAAGTTGTALGELVSDLSSLKNQFDANKLATELLATRIGDEGVQALEDFGLASQELSNEFAVAMTLMQSEVAKLFRQITQQSANNLKDFNLLAAGLSSSDPQQQQLTQRRAELLGRRDRLQADTLGVSRQPGDIAAINKEVLQIEQQIRDVQKEIIADAENRIRLKIELEKRTANELALNIQSAGTLELRRKALGAEGEQRLRINAQAEKSAALDQLRLDKQRLINRARAGEISFLAVALKLKEKQVDLDELNASIDENLAKSLNALNRPDRKAERAAKKEVEVQKSLAAEKLKQFDIDTSLSSILLDRQEQIKYELSRLSERTQLQKNILLLDEQDAQLQQAKLETLVQQEKLKREELNIAGKRLAFEKELELLRSKQETAGIGLGLRQELERLQLPTGNIFDDERMALLTEQADRYVNTLAAVNNELAIQQKILDDPRSSADAQVGAEARKKALQDQKAIYEQMLPAIAAAERQQLAYNQALSLVQGPVNSLVDGLQAFVQGTKTAEEVFADFLRTIGDQLVKTAATMIAQYIALGIAKAFAFGGAPGGGGGGDIFADIATRGGVRANGGPVAPNTTYLVGERGPELLTMGSQGGYVHNNQSSAMERYRNGGPAGTQTVNVSYSVTEINGMRFVTEDQFRAGMDQAARRGAKMGQTQTMSTLKNSRSQRSKIGL